MSTSEALTFTPGQPVHLPGPGELVFTEDPLPTGPSAAQVQAQVTALTTQNAVLQAQVAASASTVYGAAFANRFTDASPGGPRLVFAHLMASAGDYGKHYYGQCPSVADYVLDIQEAKSCGVDGFAYNIGAWSIPYQEGWNMLLEAADQVNAQCGWTGSAQGAVNACGVGKFYIYAQPDMSGFPQDTPTLCSLLSIGISHDCYYRFRGMPWFGTYAGEGGTYAQVKARFQPVLDYFKAQAPSVTLYFCPFFNVRDAAGNVPQTIQSVSNSTEISGLLSGFASAAWLFGTGTGPPLGANSALGLAELYSQQLQAAGLAWMGTVTPQYLGLAHPAPGRFYNEACGGETLDHQWQSIISSQNAGWVQLVTWNDDDESSNFTNADFGPGSPWPYLAHSSVPGYYKSKLGLQALNLYYIQWYKTGIRPSIAHDAVFAFYRTMPIGLVPTADPLGALGPFATEDGGPITDTFYLAVMATATSTITAVNGGQTPSRTVPPGLSFVRLPFVPGNVSFSLSRNGATLVSLAGEPIVSSAAVLNGNYWTGTAHD